MLNESYKSGKYSVELIVPGRLASFYKKSYHLTFVRLFFFKVLFIHEREREQRHRQREKQAPCRKPNVGLDPGSSGSRPGLKAALNC